MNKEKTVGERDNTYLLAITCYNCAPQITRVLEKISPEMEQEMAEVMVIDNRSTDSLQKTVLGYIEETGREGIHLYENVQNYSLGGSQKIAFIHGQELGVSHVIILHGDDQADPNDIPGMIGLIEDGAASTVLGSRFNKDSRLDGYDKKRIFGNKVLNRIYSLVTRRHVEDLGSGLNIFCLNDLDQDRFLNFADRLTFNFEILLDLIDRNVRFVYYPIHWSEDDQVSNARNFNVAWTAFKNLMSWKFNRSNFFGGKKKPSDYITVEVVE